MSYEVVYAEMKVAEMCAPNSTDTELTTYLAKC